MAGCAKFRGGSSQLRKECDQDQMGRHTSVCKVRKGWIQQLIDYRANISSSTPPIFSLHYPALVPWRKKTQCFHQHGWRKKREAKNNGDGCIWKCRLQISLLLFSIQLKILSLQSPDVCKRDLTIPVPFYSCEDVITWHAYH